MTERLYLGLHWGDRKASIDECTQKTLQLFRAMGEWDPALAHWYVPRESREASLARELLGAEEIREAYRDKQDAVEGQAKPDVERLGFYLVAWNGGEPGSSVVCDFMQGADARLEHCPAPNALMLKLPTSNETDVGRRLLQPPRLRDLFAKLVAMFDPDWGVLSTEGWLEAQAWRGNAGSPHVGWMIYLRKHRGTIPRKLPANVRVYAVKPHGTILSIGDSLFTSDDAGHTAMSDELAGVLEAAGLLNKTTAYAGRAAPVAAPKKKPKKKTAKPRATAKKPAKKKSRASAPRPKKTAKKKAGAKKHAARRR